jgi:hypothetical protein
MKKNLFSTFVILAALVITTSAFSTSATVLIPVTDAPVTGAVVQPTASILSLDQFSTALNSGKADVIVGVYAANTFALRVVNQVMNNPAYVSPMNGTVTQFGTATQYGTTGLLAHNYLSGAYFSKLALGQEIDIVNGDGAVRRYVVTNIRHFQALDSSSPYSNFVDVENGGAQLSSTELFNQTYTGGNKVIFQTCINANGNGSWGRLFVTATPM